MGIIARIKTELHKQRELTKELDSTLSTESAAFFLGCHEESLRRLARTGRVRSGKIAGQYRFRKEDLIAFLEKEKQAGSLRWLKGGQWKSYEKRVQTRKASQAERQAERVQYEGLMTASETANLLSLNSCTIRQAAAGGALKGLKVGGVWRFSTLDIAAYLGIDQAELEKRMRARKGKKR